MAKAWSEVADSDAYKALPPEQQEAARSQYFDQVVKPQVPAEQLDTARQQFDAQTKTPQSQQRAEKVANLEESGPLAGATDTLLKGYSLGLSDRAVAGMSAATRGVENLGLRAIGQKPPYSAGEAYDATIKARREAEKRYSDDHPIAAAGTELLGGFATPGAAKLGEYVTEGASTAGRIGRSALVGGGEGAVAGAASSDKDTTAGKVWDGIRGGVTGTAIGTALPSLGALSAPLAKRVSSGLGEIWNQMSEATTGKVKQPAEMTPQELQQVSQNVHGAIDKLLKTSGKSINDLLQDKNFLAGKPITSAEAMGRPGISQLMAVGRRQGLTPDQLESYLRQRLNETPDRIVNKLGQEAGVDPGSVQGNFDQRAKELQQQNKPLYDTAYDRKNVVSPTLTQLLERPSVKQALAGARKIAAEEGRNPDDLGLVLVHKPDARGVDPETGKQVFGPGPGSMEAVEVRNPSMQTWDYIKRALGDVVYRDRDQFGRPNLDTGGRAVRDTLGALRDELFDISPAYRKAVAAGGEPIQMREAYEKAPDLMKNTVSEDAFRKAISKYTPAQMEALKGGWINQVYEQSRSGRMKLKDMTSDAFVTKARTLLGDDQADRFIKDVRMEQVLVANAQRMMPGTNSVTRELQTADREVDEALSKVTSFARDVAQGNYVGAAVRLLKAGAAGAKTPGMNQAELDEYGRMLQLSPDKLQEAMQGAVSQINRPPSPGDRLTSQILARGTAAAANVANQ